VKGELSSVVLQREHAYDPPRLAEIEERERCYHDHWYTEKVGEIPLLWVRQLVDQTRALAESR
jgi:hypothetical protein